MSRVAIIGCGVVGSSWALLFSRAGYEVSLHDASPAAQQAAISFIRTALTDLAAQGLVGDESPEAIMGRLHITPTLEEAVAGVDYVQESAPERIDIKRDLYRKLDELVAPDVIIGSSTSGFPASAFTDGLRHAARCVVVHPTNPPHLIPFVEIVPAPWTAPETVEAADRIMRQLGQTPICLKREINGFVLNRLQSAVLAEAFRLVEDGICDAVDVDKAISDGLGLRWFFMGPFETIDLNASGGIAQYCENLGPMYASLATEQADPRQWTPELVQQIENQLRESTPADQLPSRRLWRDRSLAALISAKRRIFSS